MRIANALLLTFVSALGPTIVGLDFGDRAEAAFGRKVRRTATPAPTRP